jgi:hypothetical protein
MNRIQNYKPRALVDLRGPREVCDWEKTAQRTRDLWSKKDRPEFTLEDTTWLDRIRYRTSYGRL